MSHSLSLNPLGIGEGFELEQAAQSVIGYSLNPLGIGEGFEPIARLSNNTLALVLIP